jgi:hypothetical protein
MHSIAFECMAFFQNKGMGEIFHDQTKGFKFVCDSLHDYNILAFQLLFNDFVQYFTYYSKYFRSTK